MIEGQKLFILDVSGFIFRAYFALPPMTNEQGRATHALFGFIRSVLKLLKDFNPTHIVAVYDGPDNKKHRQVIYEHYKAHRVKDYEDLPDQIELSKEFCAFLGIQQVEIPNVEADDTMGSIAVWAANSGAQVFLCTSDKDLCQLVNDQIFVLNPWKDNLILDAPKVEELYGVPPAQIVDLLAIMGDSSDNIPGLSGFGPKTAVPLLKEFGSLENLLAHPDQVKGAKKQETLKAEADIALMSKKLATITTQIDFPKDPHDFAIGKPDIPTLKEFYLSMNFASLARELQQALHIEEKTNYHLVNTVPALHELIEKLKEADEIAVEIKTTQSRPLLATIVGIGFAIEEREAYYVPFNGSIDPNLILDALKPLFENPQQRWICHNGKSSLHALANSGITVATLSFDTILASYLLHSGTRRHALDNLIFLYFGKVKTPLKSLIGSGKKEISLELVQIEKMADHCCEDVDYILQLKHLFSPQLQTRRLESLLFDLEIPLTFVLFKMERAGVYVDLDHIATFSKEITQELDKAEKEIFTLAGETFNISSPKQLATILFQKLGIKPLKKTATGHSTDADVLEALALEYPIAERILYFRSLEKLRSTYLEMLPQEVNPHTRRVHSSFNQYIAATGRLASQDPNLQNIPVRTTQGKKIREGFRPQKEGWSYLSADYSQIELRLLAHLSGDERLITAFLGGEDIHAFTASLIFGIPLQQVSSIQRHQAKAINFGIIYGQQAYGLSRELGVDVKIALEFIESYFIRYPQVLEFVNRCIELSRVSGKAITMIGREREIPEISSSNSILRSAAERLAINTPLQGSAADLIKMAMLEIDQLLTKNKMRSQMVLQIHDELIFEAPDDELETLHPLVKKGMEEVFTLKVPLIVDINIGKNWAEC